MCVIVFNSGDGGRHGRPPGGIACHMRQIMSLEPWLTSGGQEMGDISIWVNNLLLNTPGLIISTVRSY